MSKYLTVGKPLWLVVAISGCFSGAAVAASTTGTIRATVTVTPGCLVNGQTGTSGVNFGSLDFGTLAATATSADATLQNQVGSGIFVRCTAGLSYNVQVTGSNPAPTTIYGTASSAPRYLLASNDTSVGITYTLYNSSSLTSPLPNNTNLAPSGTPDPVNGTNYPVFARINLGSFNTSLTPGTYTDTINVAVNY